MINKILAGILATGLLISCGDKKGTRNSSETEAIAAEPIIIANPLKVSLNAIVDKDDTIQVFYRFDLNSDYNSMHVVNAIVKGSNVAQNINFDIPTDQKIADIRIDLGTNKDQEKIQIKNFNMQFEGRSFNAKDTLFFQYFYPNEFIDYDRKTSTAKLQEKDGKYDPIFMPRPVFETEMQKIITPITTNTSK